MYGILTYTHVLTKNTFKIKFKYIITFRRMHFSTFLLNKLQSQFYYSLLHRLTFDNNDKSSIIIEKLTVLIVPIQ